jgi:hypothetical protein
MNWWCKLQSETEIDFELFSALHTLYFTASAVYNRTFAGALVDLDVVVTLVAIRMQIRSFSLGVLHSFCQSPQSLKLLKGSSPSYREGFSMHRLQ